MKWGKRHCWNRGPAVRCPSPEKHAFLLDYFLGPCSDCVGSTCMLEAGHEGECVYTPDDEIVIGLAHGVQADEVVA